MSNQKAFFDVFPPIPARVHEIYGAGVWMFAACLCQMQERAPIWIYHTQNDRLTYAGLTPFHVHQNIHFIRENDAKTQLWCMEEALRSGALGLVICERQGAANFRDMRRLQLAAESGGAMGLMIVPSDSASPAAQSRWHCQPVFDANDEAITSRLQCWALVKNKAGTLGEWRINWDETSHRITLV